MQPPFREEGCRHRIEANTPVRSRDEAPRCKRVHKRAPKPIDEASRDANTRVRSLVTGSRERRARPVVHLDALALARVDEWTEAQHKIGVARDGRGIEGVVDDRIEHEGV